MADERALFLIDGPNFYKNMKFGNLQRKHLDYKRIQAHCNLSQAHINKQAEKPLG